MLEETRTVQARVGTLPSRVGISTAAQIMLRTGASSCRSAESAAAARPSGETKAARSSSMVSHSNSATR
ncbi:hypothetical protein ACH47Z_39020 [Streptomyces sp. NPDC020192]|uniref:hypothetical protein n=1 Tax=Streptomyces sp. NPDC020192 TaxID=3365066 RepID=UPI0037B5C077